MNKYLYFIFLLLLNNKIFSQRIELSTQIAQKMQDSLYLSSEQRDSIYAINNRLQSQKMQARMQYAGADSIQYHLQRIENTRDSLYKPVLGAEKYLLYKQKKRNLISAN